MGFKTLCVINTIVAGAFGIAFVAAPVQTMAMYGPELTPGGAFLAQLMGAAFIGFALITWFAKGAEDSEARSAISLGICFGDTIGCILCIMAAAGDVVNALGWSSVAIYLLIAAGFGYFRFIKPSAA